MSARHYRVCAPVVVDAAGVPRIGGPVALPAPTLTEAKRLGARLGEGATIGDRWGNLVATYQSGRWVQS